MKKPNTRILIIGVFLIVGVTVAGLLLSDRVVVSVKSPKASVEVRNNVCSSELISEYNATFSKESQEEYTESLSNAAKKVDELKGAESDPNCVYIQFSYYLDSEDVGKARERLDVLKSLAQQGSYITGELANPQGLEGAETTLTILETSKNPEPSTGEQEDLSGRG